MKKYLSVIPLVLVLCFVVSCQDKAAMAELEQFKAQAALEEQNKELAMRLADAFQNNDLEALRALCSPNVLVHTPQGDFHLEEVLESYKHELVMFPDLKMSLEDVLVVGDKIIERFSSAGTHTGDVEGFSATGNKLKSSGIGIFRVENGKIVEQWSESDYLSFYQQLGFELKPKEAGK